MVDGGIHICYQLQPQTLTQLGFGPDSTNIFAMSLHGPPRGAHPPTPRTVDPMYLSHNFHFQQPAHRTSYERLGDVCCIQQELNRIEYFCSCWRW